MHGTVVMFLALLSLIVGVVVGQWGYDMKHNMSADYKITTTGRYYRVYCTNSYIEDNTYLTFRDLEKKVDVKIPVVNVESIQENNCRYEGD